MDALINAAGRALAHGDPLGALQRVALRDDPPALALRGIAMAQLGDFDRAKALLKRAAKTFGPRETVARARCVIAEADIALASRDLGWKPEALDAARLVLEQHGDFVNAAHARYLGVRRALLLGRLDEAERSLGTTRALPARLRAVHELAVAGIAMRRLQMRRARKALARADEAARKAGIPALTREIDAAREHLNAPAARLVHRGEQRIVVLDDVEALGVSRALIVDACAHMLRHRGVTFNLSKRPVVFAIARALAEAWPNDVPREALIARAFATRRVTESLRARLRVEVGRLRSLLRTHSEIHATPGGYVLRAADVVVLAPPRDEPHAEVLALLADGQAWSSSALAIAMNTSQRTVQRALDTLHSAGKAQASGRARNRRWVASPLLGFTTTLLLPTDDLT